MTGRTALCGALIFGWLVSGAWSAEKADGRFVDGFQSVENLREINNVTQRRDFPRIVTRPDVRINRLDPQDYKDSQTGKPIGYGWFPVILRLHNGDLLCIYREGAEHGMANIEGRAVAARSIDGGRTWQDAVVIKEEKGCGVSPMFATQTDDGTIWLSGFRLKVAGEGKGKWSRFESHSTDNGLTWQDGGLGAGYEIGPQLSNGEVLLLGRNGHSHPWKTNRTTVRVQIKDGAAVAKNEAASDVWKYRTSSRILGRMTQDASADQYSYDRTGRYDAAQSFALEKAADISSIEVFLTGCDGCRKGVTLSLCRDADGAPSDQLVADNARTEAPPFSDNGFLAFKFAQPVHVDAGKTVWMVLTKDDEPGENLTYSVPLSSKDDAGAARDWYPAGRFVERGPYKDASKPSKWRPLGTGDAYFIINEAGKRAEAGEKITHVELGPSSDEWSVAETSNPGELVAMMRQQQHSHFFATAKSFDYGKTWTPWQPSNVYMGCVPSRPVVHRMANGWLIFVYGQRWVGRTFAVASKDNGETWDVDHRLTILHSPAGYHRSWDSHYTDAAWAEGPYWLAVDYVASPDDTIKRGIYGTFLDTRYFDDMCEGITLTQFDPPNLTKTAGYWKFDELEGDFARDSAHANFGEIHGPERVPGRFGNALRFDGKDDHVMVYNDASMWVPRYFSIEAWVNTADATEEQTILSKAPAYTLGLRDGKPFVEIGKNTLAAEMKVPLESNRWVHLAFVYDMKHNYTRGTFYVDGKDVSYMKPTGPQGGYMETYDDATVVNDVEITDGPTFQEYHSKNRSTDNLVIGMDNDLAGRPFHGTIDEVLIHGFELFPQQVRASASRAYLPRGVVASLPITRPAGAKWTTFEATTTKPGGTTVRFDLLDTQGKPLLGNLASGANLSALDADAIVLRAELATSETGQTPILHAWSVGATDGAPRIVTEPFPDQNAPLAKGKSRSARASALKPKASAPKVDDDAVAIAPKRGLPVDLYQVPIGAKRPLVFNVPYAPDEIAKAWLALAVDDIDETKEARITLNGKPVAIHASVLGEGDNTGVLVLPVDALKKGENTFEFTFVDDLDGTTEGYQILNATLLVKPASGATPAKGEVPL